MTHGELVALCLIQACMEWVGQEIKQLSFSESNSPIEEINAEIETDRYIAWPGQACSYKMGQLKIEELTQKS
jgi:uncharacterized protein (DUF885 family)